MKYAYPILITEEDGAFLVSVPDLPGCHTFGETFPEAIEMARDAAAMWLCIAEDNGEPIPAPSMHIQSDVAVVGYVDIDTLEYRRLNDNRAVKKTLSIPAWLNAKAIQNGVNFSAVLQEALKARLNIA